VRVFLVGHDGDDPGDVVPRVEEQHALAAVDVEPERHEHMLLLDGILLRPVLHVQLGVVDGLLAGHDVQPLAQPRELVAQVALVELADEREAQADAGVVLRADRGHVLLKALADARFVTPRCKRFVEPAIKHIIIPF